MMTEARKMLEKSVANCVMMKPSLIRDLDIDLKDFKYIPARTALEAIREINDYDIVFVKNYAEKHNLDVKIHEITEMVLMVASTTHFDTYVNQLKERIIADRKKELREEAKKSISLGLDASQIVENLAKSEEQIENKYSSINDSGSLDETIFEYLEKIEHGEPNNLLLATNWPEFDEMHGGGLLPNELVILAARPSCGKTAAALQISLSCNEKVCFFSIEMDKRQLVARLLASIAKENTKTASRNPNALTHYSREKLLNATNLIYGASNRLRVYDEPDQSIDSIRKTARKEVANGARLVVIDYLQLINSSNSRKEISREREVAEISRSLKNMAKELNVPVLVLAQLNRSCESEKRAPKLSDLRESGSIEQDANSVLFLHDTGKADYRNYKQIMLYLAKGRDVGVGYRIVVFNSDYQTFETLPPQN